MYNGRYIPNKNEEISGSKLCYGSRSYLVTKAAQSLDHMLNPEQIMAVLNLKINQFIPVCDLVKIGVIKQILKWGQELSSSCHFLHKTCVLMKQILLLLKVSNII